MTRSRPDERTGAADPEADVDADVRVVWHPGSAGDLVGTCRCGERYRSPDPRAVWNWYAAHGHPPAASSGAGP